MSETDIQYLNDLIQAGNREIDNSFTMESMKLALGNFFQLSDYDDRIINQILNKLSELGWDTIPEQTELNYLREGIKVSKVQLNSLIKSEKNVFESLDECLMIYRNYCINWIYLDQLKKSAIIMAKNYIKTKQES